MIRGRHIRAGLCACAAIMAPGAALAAPVDSAPPPDDRSRALQCMTLAIAYEAGNEPLAGQQAVGEVILNRTRHPAYPKSVCGVVFQGSARKTGCQFTFTCDGALHRALTARTMLAAREVARQVLDGEAGGQVGGATHYHATYVQPYWAPSLIRVGRIGAHIFYRAPGSIDAPARYAPMSEPALATLGNWATATDPITQGPFTQGPRRQIPPERAAETAPARPAPQVFAPWGLSVR